MADPKHVKILKKGVEEWNAWRRKSPGVIPDIDGENLKEGVLIQVDLFKADLSGADLAGTDLSKAELFLANLNGANLRGADLYKANLSGANLNGANLEGANFYGANLNHAELKGADFSNSAIGMTIFADVDLSEVKGLDTVTHLAPSSIGIDTIYRSQGKIPEIFLRKAGVPKTLIEYIPSLVAAQSPIQRYSCFISHSHKDHEFAERLYNDLQGKGVRCWFAPEDMKIGDRLRARIDESIRIFDKLLLILSKDSIASDWVETEVETAFEKERKAKTKSEKHVLFPLRLDESIMRTRKPWAADIRRTRHIGEFTNWKDHDEYKKAFDRLLRDLAAE